MKQCGLFNASMFVLNGDLSSHLNISHKVTLMNILGKSDDFIETFFPNKAGITDSVKICDIGF